MDRVLRETICEKITFSRPLAKDTFARGGEKVKGQREKEYLTPFPLSLFPTSARSLV
jgi:hypothetical protein